MTAMKRYVEDGVHPQLIIRALRTSSQLAVKRIKVFISCSVFDTNVQIRSLPFKSVAKKAKINVKPLPNALLLLCHQRYFIEI